MFQLPKIYPITDTPMSGLSHAGQVEALIAGGATLIQLREKHASPREFFAAAEEAIEAAKRAGVSVLINDRVDIAMITGAGGVHLGQDDMPPTAARNMLGPDAIIGFSTHTVEQAVEAESLPVDYIAVGPVFQTTSKADPDRVIGLDGLAAVRERVSKPLVAIGGINADNVAAVLAAGADSAAIISAIISGGSDIGERFRRLNTLAERAQPDR